jgi:hypothetical protein
MKKILYFLLCLILCVGLGGSAFILYKNLAPEKTPTTQGGDANADDGVGDAAGFEEPPTNSDNSTDEEETPLTPPADETSYICDGMEMMAGASVYMGSDSSLDPAIRFTCLIDNELKDAVEADENKSFAILAAPLDYFDEVNPDSTTYIDWVNAFAEANKTVILTTYDAYGTYNDYTSYIRFNLTNVLFNNINRRFVAMGVLIDNSGETPVYKYSAMPEGQTYRSNARSVAYVAGAALNAHAIGETEIPEEQHAKLLTYIDMAVDKANGLSEYTNNGDMPEVTITSGTSITMGLNGSHTIDGTIEPAGLDIPARFVSSNESVVTVNEYGVLYARGYGSATVKMYYAGVEYTFSVTCSSNVQYM